MGKQKHNPNALYNGLAQLDLQYFVFQYVGPEGSLEFERLAPTLLRAARARVVVVGDNRSRGFSWRRVQDSSGDEVYVLQSSASTPREARKLFNSVSELYTPS